MLIDCLTNWQVEADKANMRLKSEQFELGTGNKDAMRHQYKAAHHLDYSSCDSEGDNEGLYSSPKHLETMLAKKTSSSQDLKSNLRPGGSNNIQAYFSEPETGQTPPPPSNIIKFKYSDLSTPLNLSSGG